METTNPKYFPDLKNLRDSVTVLGAVGLSALVTETTSVCDVGL